MPTRAIWSLFVNNPPPFPTKLIRIRWPGRPVYPNDVKKNFENINGLYAGEYPRQGHSIRASCRKAFVLDHQHYFHLQKQE